MKEYTYRDIVSFYLRGTTYTYKVNDCFLHSMDSDNNRQLFTDLGMTSQELQEFCTKCYGYEAGSGDWPTCRDNDYDALNRCIDKLFELCEEHNQVVTSEKKDLELLDIYLKS